MLKLSVIICTYNREKYLPLAIEALLKQKCINLSDFEIIIVNNNSTDNTENIALSEQKKSKEINIIYVTEQKQGLSNARNKGIEVANGTLLAFLDDDAFACENYIQRVFDFFEKYKDAKAVGGRILLHFEVQKPDWYTNYLGSLLGYFNPWNELRVFNKKQYPRGSNMVYKRELFDKYGGFNPELGRKGESMLGSEEKEMFQRIYSGNEKIYYYPDAIIEHIVPVERTLTPFIKTQSIAVGKSERIRIVATNKGIYNKVFEEFIKWNASIVLCLFFILTLRQAKGIMLLRFRYWVWLGLNEKM